MIQVVIQDATSKRLVRRFALDLNILWAEGTHRQAFSMVAGVCGVAFLVVTAGGLELIMGLPEESIRKGFWHVSGTLEIGLNSMLLMVLLQRPIFKGMFLNGENTYQLKRFGTLPSPGQVAQ
mmetsp:Transcript_14434/g.26750  ORF Transcript_14434/g.26750 Transcript_14434/m.26750 type:complete len:122 (-) Transcript_14434:186-551(-)